eukprot:14983890-Alexandrium_andersonii.AAC.1
MAQQTKALKKRGEPAFATSLRVLAQPYAGASHAAHREQVGPWKTPSPQRAQDEGRPSVRQPMPF